MLLPVICHKLLRYVKYLMFTFRAGSQFVDQGVINETKLCHSGNCLNKHLPCCSGVINAVGLKLCRSLSILRSC